MLGASWLFHAHLQLVNYKLEAIGLPMSSWVQAEALGWAGELPWPQLSPRAKQVPSAALRASPKHCISIEHEKNPPGWPGHFPQPSALPKAGSWVLRLKAGVVNGISKPTVGPAMHVWKWEELRGQILLLFAQPLPASEGLH